jgi:predicted transcriptional regulator of viral defense system
MRTTEVYAKLIHLNRLAFTTREVSSLLKVGESAAYYFLSQLVKDGLLVRVKRGLWGIVNRLTPYALPEYLTSPYPSYISLWTAMHHHGMVTQIPRIIYVVSVDRPKRITTALGTFQVHKISPELFGGFELKNGGKVATAEKSLFDTVYILGIWRKRTVRLPELELPEEFDTRKLQEWVERIPERRLRSVTAHHLERVLPRNRAASKDEVPITTDSTRTG